MRRAKESLNDICLAHPDYTKQIDVMEHASDYGIGRIILELEGYIWRSIQWQGDLANLQVSLTESGVPTIRTIS